MTPGDFSAYPNKISLDIELQSSDEYPNSAFMLFTFDFVQVFGSNGKIPVRFTVGEHSYRSTIAVYDGMHMMVFNKQMRLDTGFKAGDVIHGTLERDTDPRSVEIPEDVHRELEFASVLSVFCKYSYSHQKEIVDWINDAKKQETRTRRIAKLIAKLLPEK